MFACIRRIFSQFFFVLCNILTNMFWSDNPETILAFLSFFCILCAWSGQYAQVDGIFQIVTKLLTSIANQRWEQFHLIRHTGGAMTAPISFAHWVTIICIFWLFAKLFIVLGKRREHGLIEELHALSEHIKVLNSGLSEVGALTEQISKLRADLNDKEVKRSDKPDSEQFKSVL